jgi:hypothetical protein
VRPKTFGVQCVIQHRDAMLLVHNAYGRYQRIFSSGSIARRKTAENVIRRDVCEAVCLRLRHLPRFDAFTAAHDNRRDHVVGFAGVSPDRQVTIDPPKFSRRDGCSRRTCRLWPRPQDAFWRCGSGPNWRGRIGSRGLQRWPINGLCARQPDEAPAEQQGNLESQNWHLISLRTTDSRTHADEIDTRSPVQSC